MAQFNLSLYTGFRKKEGEESEVRVDMCWAASWSWEDPSCAWGLGRMGQVRAEGRAYQEAVSSGASAGDPWEAGGGAECWVWYLTLESLGIWVQLVAVGTIVIPEQESDGTWGNLVSQVEQDKEGSVAIICGSCLL